MYQNIYCSKNKTDKKEFTDFYKSSNCVIPVSQKLYNSLIFRACLVTISKTLCHTSQHSKTHKKITYLLNIGYKTEIILQNSFVGLRLFSYSTSSQKPHIWFKYFLFFRHSIGYIFFTSSNNRFEAWQTLIHRKPPFSIRRIYRIVFVNWTWKIPRRTIWQFDFYQTTWKTLNNRQL